MKFNYVLIMFLTILASKNSIAIECSKNNNAPLCPDSGSTLLDETYPTQAFVISNAPQRRGLQSNKVTSAYISAIAKSYDYESMPQVFVPVSSAEEMSSIVADIKVNLTAKKVSPEKIEKILTQITHVATRKYTWQQDYFESFVDLKTGKPVLREFESYVSSRPETSGAVAKIQQAGKTCDISEGEKLRDYHMGGANNKSNEGEASFGSGEMGGNVEGAPGGFCLTGNNQSKKLASTYCGKEENVIQLQTSWLQVGHVDEIFKIIPSQFSDGRPKECQFSLFAASPRKALELMDASNGKRQPFNSFSPRLSNEELTEVKRSRARDGNGSYGNRIICGYIKNAIRDGSFLPTPARPTQTPGGGAKQVFLNFIMAESYAGMVRSGVDRATEAPFNCEDYIDQIPNENIHQAILKDEKLIKLNNQIQDSIDKDKELIKNKILARLPQCGKYFDILDAPDLFYGSAPIEKDGKLQLPNPGDINSFMPNPTNSVLMNKTILLSESGNPSFDNYVEQELSKRKIKTEKIDTWDYAHVGQGNIHCSSHSIPLCKPR